MAKKKEDGFSYMQLPLPSGSKYSKMTKLSFSGLNKRQTIDTGALSMEKNISTSEAPYLTPSMAKSVFRTGGYTYPISLFGFDDSLIVVFRYGSMILIDYILWREDEDGSVTKKSYRGVLKKSGATWEDEVQRSIVQFNVYDTPTDPIDGRYIKRYLIFPDKLSLYSKIEDIDSDPTKWDSAKIASYAKDVLYFCTENNCYYEFVKDENGDDIADQNGTEGYFYPDAMDVEVKSYTNTSSPYFPPDTASHNHYWKNTHKTGDPEVDESVYFWVVDEEDSSNTGWRVQMPPSFPPLKYATVHLSRLFGVSDDRVYASGFNDYSNWKLDSSEYNEANAWCSPTQSNTKAGGSFTGITTFQNHVVCFKRDFMHEIYNTKNPFRVQDIYAEGAIDNRTLQDVGGKLIFVADGGVKVYTGSNPRDIGYNLNITEFREAVSGTDGRNYYLYCKDESGQRHLFTYDSLTGQWSEQEINTTVFGFAHNKYGMFMLCYDENGDGAVYKMDTNEYNHIWSFETDLITNQTVDIKHIKKIQMLADIGDNASLYVYILYGDEVWDPDDPDKHHLVYASDVKGKVPIRVKPRNKRNANYGFKLHVEGSGYVRIYELEILFQQGGDLFV